MKVESSGALYTETSITEKAAVQIAEQHKEIEILQNDTVTLSSSTPTDSINSGNSGGELPPKKKDPE